MEKDEGTLEFRDGREVIRLFIYLDYITYFIFFLLGLFFTLRGDKRKKNAQKECCSELASLYNKIDHDSSWQHISTPML